MSNTATQAFIAAIDGARRDLATIQEALDDHLGFDPDKVHWANVGDATRLRDELRQIADRLLRRGEYAG